MPRVKPLTPLTLLALSALFMCTPDGWAQTTSPARKKPLPRAIAEDVNARTGTSDASQPSGATPIAIEFAEDPLQIASVGLKIQRPLDSISQTDSAGRDSIITILPKDNSWTMKVKAPRSADPGATITQVADLALQVIFDSYGLAASDARDAVANGKLLREPAPGQSLQVAGYDAERWYITLPALESKEPTIRGYSVIKIAPAQFVVYELLTVQSSFARARATFQTLIATTTIEDPALLAASRAASVGAGLELTRQATPDILREIVSKHPERWERRFKPAASGLDEDATEIAYRRIILREGTRNDVQPGKKSVGGETEGIVALIDARVVTAEGAVADSRSGFFTSFDRSEESWVLNNAVRNIKPSQDSRNPRKQPGEVFTASEIGARHDQSMAVTTTAEGQDTRTTKPQLGSEGYLSQVEVVLLPHLLMKVGTPLDHGFYVWNSLESKIMLRTDRIEPITTASGDKGFKITTTAVEGRMPQVAYYDEAGKLLRTEMPDGTVWEPTTLPDLKRIWESKGLPTK
jgi:hypothetical protein